MITFVELGANELSPNAKRGQGPADGAGLTFLHEVFEAFARFRPGAGGQPPFAIPDRRLADGQALIPIKVQEFSLDGAMGIALAEPDQAPFHFEILVEASHP